MAKALIATGSNLGDRAATLDAAVSALAQTSGIELLRQSAWQMTLPVGGRAVQNKFLNGAVLVETSRTPQELLTQLQEIEDQFGRERGARWSDRTLDLDLLLYDDSVIDTPSLTLPHPRMSFRRFVLEPAVEIAADMVHPAMGWTLEQLLTHLESGADTVALVSDENSQRDDIALALMRRYEFELCGPPLRDESRWPAHATTFLRVPLATQLTGMPKLTIVSGNEMPRVAGRGPTLSVLAADGQEVTTDVFAAIAAVWPHLAVC
jgi:2-amino-4-hydroxy-6-hydroxymethyldihydropteridine diphosphokinase